MEDEVNWSFPQHRTLHQMLLPYLYNCWCEFRIIFMLSVTSINSDSACLCNVSTSVQDVKHFVTNICLCAYSLHLMLCAAVLLYCYLFVCDEPVCCQSVMFSQCYWVCACWHSMNFPWLTKHRISVWACSCHTASNVYCIYILVATYFKETVWMWYEWSCLRTGPSGGLF